MFKSTSLVPLPLDRRAFLRLSASSLGTSLLSAIGHAQQPNPKPRGLVVGQVQAAEAGNAMLAAGGNAVDAAVAAALVAAVVSVHNTGIGGYGGHLVVATPRGDVAAIDFNTAAPAALRPDTFPADANGKVKGDINTYGYLAAGVPGILAGLQLALDRFGSRGFADVVRPAIRYARDGFPVDRGLANAINSAKERFSRDPASARIFYPGGEPLAAGATLRNPDLADMLQTLAKRGNVATFYKGDIADAIAAAFRKNGGLVTADDLAAYRALEVKPLAVDFQGHRIFTPPPTAGGLTTLQALATLRAIDWSKWDANDPASTQVRVEALRIAWNDRLRYLGDPRKIDVPIDRLLSEEYARTSAGRVREAVKARKPLEGVSDGRPSGGTVHLSAMDASGMAAAITLTHGSYFGAQVTVDGLGLLLGHGMSRFDPRPGRANSPAPGKRPLDNMCPMVVLREGKPVLALGAVGGRRIVNTLFDVLAYRLGQSMPLPEAVKAPRLHTEGDLKLTLEATWPAAIKDWLKTSGYELKAGPGAVLNAIERNPTTGELVSAMR